uniref:EGF-like domain-containing protein n=2 Tax=Culex quinquefasciatus TaxID=7176 RepID=A0A1S4K5J7_CULQU
MIFPLPTRVDINECLDPQACGVNAECVNVPGNYTCLCRDGFVGDPYNGCADVDECAQPGVCGPGAICTNVEGGYRCDCPAGFDGDARSAQGCADFDECTRSPCGRNALCRNDVGSFRCECPEGFHGDAMTDCQDIDECSNNPCAEGAQCINTPGGFRCSCPAGMTGSGDGHCDDINECARANACGENAKCINFPGSYKCLCPQGFQGRDPFRGCVDIDECTAFDKPCGNHAICENANPGYNCLCPQGYAGKPDPKIACEQADVNVLCKSNFDCTNNAECIEGQCFCQDGFEPQGSSCVDIDECRMDAHVCGPSAMCINTPGSFRCDCEAGFIGTPPRIQCKTPCADVKCGKNAYCKAEGQEAFCICEEGWTFNPNDISAGCVDINECDPGQGPNGRCGVNAACTNLPGSFSCQCPPGFTGDASRQCYDVDECSKPNACGEGAVCKNLEGSHKCSCPEGSIADPDPRVCKDINECKDPNKPACGVNAICKNLPGSYECQCPPGFNGNPFLSCEECSSLECKCPAPYKFMDGNCVLDSCSTDGKCAGGAECITITGGVSYCACPKGFRTQADGKCEDIDEFGYKGDPLTGCTDEDECANSPCAYGAQCVNQKGGYKCCVCPNGFIGNPYVQCKDIDECSTGNVCGEGALCINSAGSFDCRCKPGLAGNPF